MVNNPKSSQKETNDSPKEKKNIPTKILRIGIIGVGDIWNSHVQAYPDNPNAVVVGFYDRIKGRAEAWKDKIARYMNLINEAATKLDDPEDEVHVERCQIFEKEAKVYDSVQDLIEHVDVIDICSPNYTHAPYTIWALSKNKSVMTEKPAARCSYETQKICDIAENSKGFFQLNENFLWYASLRKLHSIIAAKKIGTITKISIRLGHGHPSWGWQNHFLNPSLSGGGVLSDMGVHALGWAYGILGSDFQVKSVQSIRMNGGTTKERTLHQYDGSNEYYLQSFMVEDDAKIKVIFQYPDTDSDSNSEAENEVNVLIEASWAKTYREITIHGTEGTCGLERNEDKREIIVIYHNNGQREEISIPSQGRDSHQIQIIDFLDRIQKGKNSYLDQNWAHNIQEIISCSYLSNLKAFEKNAKKGLIITPKDLHKFYDKLKKSGVPEEIIVEEIVYSFMSPFTSSYYNFEPNPANS
ncbi:MAG: Gfo/Idh/MocA family protein [Promethearchaeota archaeon]